MYYCFITCSWNLVYNVVMSSSKYGLTYIKPQVIKTINMTKCHYMRNAFRLGNFTCNNCWLALCSQTAISFTFGLVQMQRKKNWSGYARLVVDHNSIFCWEYWGCTIYIEVTSTDGISRNINNTLTGWN